MRILKSTLFFLMLSFSANATDVKIILGNDTDEEVRITKFVTNYSIVPEDIDLVGEAINKKERKNLGFSILSRSFADIHSSIEEGNIEKDGVYLEIKGVPFAVIWYLHYGKGFEPELLLQSEQEVPYKLLKKKEKGSVFSFIFKEKENLD